MNIYAPTSSSMNFLSGKIRILVTSNSSLSIPVHQDSVFDGVRVSIHALASAESESQDSPAVDY